MKKLLLIFTLLAIASWIVLKAALGSGSNITADSVTPTTVIPVANRAAPTYAETTNALGVIPAALFPALTGDITTTAGALATTMKSTGTAGTYRSVTTDAQGRVTAGTAPTTFSGYAISDTSANLAAALTDETGSGGGGLSVFNQSPTIVTPTVASFVNATHSHQNAAGGGTLAEAALALTDITTANVSTSAHGFAPKAPNDATKYLDGTGAYSIPAGSGGGATMSGTVSNAVASAGLLAVDATKTNGIAVTSAHVISALGTASTPQFARVGIGAAADATHLIEESLGTITADTHAIDITGTLNSAGTTFTIIKANITRTASGGPSKLIDLQTGGVTALSCNLFGALTLSGANSGVTLDSGGNFVFTSRSQIQSLANGDITFLNAGSAGFSRLRLGPDVASPSNVLIRPGDGSGTDKAGGNFELDGGISTGTGRGGNITMVTSETSTTGSSANVQVKRFHLEPKPVDLTGGTATLVFNVSLASGKTVGLHVFATTRVDDGTDFQGATDDFTVAAGNKGGTVTVGAVSTSLGSNFATSGTISTVWTAVANGSGVDVKCNETTTVMTPTTRRVKWRVEIDSNDTALAVTPQ